MKILVVDDGFKKNTENDNFLNLMPWLTNGEMEVTISYYKIAVWPKIPWELLLIW